MRLRSVCVMIALAGSGFLGGRAEAQLLQRVLAPVLVPNDPEPTPEPDSGVLECSNVALVGTGEGSNDIEAENNANAAVEGKCAQAIQNQASGCCSIHSCGLLEEGPDGDYKVFACWGNPYTRVYR